MKLNFFTISILALAAFSTLSYANEHKSVKELREAVRLFDIGMHARSQTILNKVGREYGSADAKGYAVLCDVLASTPGYEVRMAKFFKESCLLNQEFIQDSKMTVTDYLQATDKELTVVTFNRFTLRAE